VAPATGGAGISGAGFTVTNTGTIAGGDCGTATFNGTGSQPGGAGGVGIVGTGGATVINEGTISGGTAGATIATDSHGQFVLTPGTLRADAIHFTGGGNTLELVAGHPGTFNGAIVVTRQAGEAADTLELGGASGSDSFDLTGLAGGGAFAGFNAATKSGASTWTLTGAGSGTRDWTIEGGALQGDATAFQGDIRLAPTSGATATVVFDQGSANANSAANASYAGVVSGDGGFTKTGDGTLTLTGASSYTGATIVSAGTLVVGDGGALGTGAIVDNGALVFDRGDAVTLAGAIAGNGSLAQQGQGKLTVNGDGGAFAGTTRVAAGTLVVGDDSHSGATLGGTVTVATGATLGGIGSIGALDLSGTLSPGNSIGTLHVSGDATIERGASMRIEATPDGHADRLAVGGKATILGGSALVLAQDGNWAPRTDYVIVTAAGGVSGTFASTSSSLAFLQPVLSYTANAVNLSLQRNHVGFADVGDTPNRKATARGAESLGLGTPVYDALVKLDAPGARHAFDQLDGEIHPDTLGALIEDDRYVRDAVNRHLLGLGDGAEGRNAQGTSAWLSGWGHWGRDDGDGNAASLRANGSGLLLGADRAIGDGSRLGVLLGHGQGSLDVDARGASAHVLGHQLGAYGDTAFGALHLRAAAIHAWQDVDTQRTVAFPGFDERLASRRHVRTDQAYVEAGYRFTLSHGRQLEPFVNLARTQLHADATRENGGQSALAVAAADPSVNSAALGLRGMVASKAGLHLHASLAWQQGWGDITPVTTMRFITGGDSFAIAGVPLARHALLANLGMDFPLARKVTLDASYLGQFATRYRDQGARLSLTVAF
jgi:outer membrane autotransporter protein